MSDQPKGWVCPYCQQAQVIVEGQFFNERSQLDLKSSRYGDCALHINATACSHPDCGEVTISAYFTQGKFVSTSTKRLYTEVKPIETYRLRPSSQAKPQPDCIPKPLRNDYEEACKIRDLSPKASATLSRRVLQGMIRDFCKISKARLVDEIDELKKISDAGNAPKGVEPETIEAMHHVRSIGNIGAHMEKDIDIIVDVDPNEAQSLIELIELLFADWYVARKGREDKLAKLKAVADAKSSAKNSTNPSTR
jgi:hypothetical protein